MKKILSSLIILSVLLCFTFQTYAADKLHRITHADQDALIVGQINRQEGDNFIINVLHVLNGNLEQQTIKVNSDFQYEYLNSNPKVDDFGLFSLNKSMRSYKVVHGAYKADGGDYKNLKFLTSKDMTHGQKGDLAVLEYYTNSDGEEDNFYFEGTTAYVLDKNGERKVIYSAEEDEKIEVEPQEKVVSDYSTEKKEESTNVKVNNTTKAVVSSNNLSYIYIGLILLFIAIIIYFIDRKTNNK